MVAGLPPRSTPVLNADDPAVAALGRGARRASLTFGIDDPSVASARPAPRRRLDALPRLRGAARPTTCVTLGHLGALALRGVRGRAARGPTCARRGSSCAASAASRVAIETPGGPVEAELALPGLHNAYNATAAAAAALAMGVAAGAIGRRPGRAARPPSGAASGCAWTAGSWCCCWRRTRPAPNETVRTVLLDPEPPHLLIALNDRTADGHDVSWIWDVDYEPLLARAGLAHPDRRPGLRPGAAHALRRASRPSG